MGVYSWQVHKNVLVWNMQTMQTEKTIQGYNH